MFCLFKYKCTTLKGYFPTGNGRTAAFSEQVLKNTNPKPADRSGICVLKIRMNYFFASISVWKVTATDSAIFCPTASGILML